MSLWRIGRRKATVFPLPVIADASTSRPSRPGGIAASWIGVGWRNPRSFRPFNRAWWSFNAANGMSPLSTGMIRMPFDARWAAFVESAGSATEPRLPAACDSVRETDRDGLARSRGAQGRTRHDAGGTARAAGQLTHEAPMATLNGTRGSSYAIRAGYGSYTCSLVSTFQQIRTILFASATTATFR